MMPFSTEWGRECCFVGSFALRRLGPHVPSCGGQRYSGKKPTTSRRRRRLDALENDCFIRVSSYCFQWAGVPEGLPRAEQACRITEG